jgi:MATE family multidrug resistance protein
MAGAALSVIGCAVLLFPEPFTAVAGLAPGGDKVRAYLNALAFALPAALLFTAFRGFNTAVSRPKAVMALQLSGLALKVPLNALLVFGWGLSVPALGVAGCGIATAIVMWGQAAGLRGCSGSDPFYKPFGLHAAAWRGPTGTEPRGPREAGRADGPVTILIEVTGFTFMAIFIARIGATPVAGHQLAVANLVALMFMMPMALATPPARWWPSASAPRTWPTRGAWLARLASRLIAAGAGRRGLPGREPVLALYTHECADRCRRAALLAWLCVFHIADALQTVAAFVLRAYRVTTRADGDLRRRSGASAWAAASCWPSTAIGARPACARAASGQPPRRAGAGGACMLSLLLQPGCTARNRRAACAPAEPLPSASAGNSTKQLPPPSRGRQRTLHRRGARRSA